jgi:hypothetical protein
MDLQEIVQSVMSCIELPQDRHQSRAVVKAVMILRVGENTNKYSRRELVATQVPWNLLRINPYSY